MSDRQGLTMAEYEAERDATDPSAHEIVQQYQQAAGTAEKWKAAVGQAKQSLSQKAMETAEPANELTSRAARAMHAVLLQRGGR
jgi:hypothetical protein